jgi:hypothetical protein
VSHQSLVASRQSPVASQQPGALWFVFSQPTSINKLLLLKNFDVGRVNTNIGGVKLELHNILKY